MGLRPGMAAEGSPARPSSWTPACWAEPLVLFSLTKWDKTHLEVPQASCL